MKRSFLILAALAVMAPVFGATNPAAAQAVNDFTVQSFTADYYLSRSEGNRSQLRVAEQIVAEFPDIDQNHGILRAVPREYDGHTVDLQILNVTNQNDQPWNYTTYEENNNTVLKIGDADTFVHGEQTYNIEYALNDVTKNFDNHDEFFWDVNGTEWRQTFNEVTARIHVPNDVAAQFNDQTRCITGTAGATGADCTITVDESSGKTVITAQTTRALLPNENMSVVVGFEPGTFEPYKLDIWSLVLIIAAAFIGLVILPLAAFIIMWRKWRAHGRDPAGKGTIIPRYTPPDSLNPVLADIVLSEKMDTVAVSATALGLCIKKYAKLYETKKKKLFGSKTEYELELVKDPSDLSPQEQKVAAMLFGTKPSVGARVNLNEQKNKLYSKVASLQKSANRAVAKQGYFTSNPADARKKYLWRGFVLLAVGFVGTLFSPLMLLAVGLMIAGVIVFLFSNVMPARTQKGVATKEHLLGLKEYMQIAERDRIKVLQSPEGAEKTQVDPKNKSELVKLYEELLPYAMLFGIEKDWAKRFAHLYEQPPEWYNGSGRAFRAGAFAGAISGFSSASNSSFSAPSSSGSSGFSGGGSGGGGGGGGGGGW